MGAFLNFETLS